MSQSLHLCYKATYWLLFRSLIWCCILSRV